MKKKFLYLAGTNDTKPGSLLSLEDLTSLKETIHWVANPMNKKIIEFLRKNQPASVTGIYTHLRCEQSFASNKLRILKDAGFIFSTPAGKQRLYAVNEKRIAAVKRLTRELIDLTGKMSVEDLLKKSIKLLRALAHPTRFEILQLLIDTGEANVTTIYNRVRIDQTDASAHLKQLRETGLVSSRRDGRNITYIANIGWLQEIREIVNS